MADRERGVASVGLGFLALDSRRWAHGVGFLALGRMALGRMALASWRWLPGVGFLALGR